MIATPQSPLFQPLTLPNGQVIPNRIAKAAMEENMAAPASCPAMSWTRCTAGEAPVVRAC